MKSRNLRDLNEAARILEGVSREFPDEAWAFHELGNCYVKMKRARDGVKALRSACRLNRAAGDSSKLGRVLNDLGNAYVAAGDVSNAIDTLREAVGVEQRSGGEGLGRVLNDLGNAYVTAGDVSNAIDTLREAVDAVSYTHLRAHETS